MPAPSVSPWLKELIADGNASIVSVTALTGFKN